MKRLKLPLTFLMIVFILSVCYHIFYLENVDSIFSIDSPFTLSSLILATLFLFLRLLDLILWTPARNVGSTKIPKLFVDLLNMLLLVIVLLFLLNKVFNKPVTGILAASGALGVIIGLSMQRILADIFTGVAINMDRTVNLGDWVEYEGPGSEKVIGQVKEINWRALKLQTYSNNFVVIPNGLLANTSITNLSTPSPKSMFDVELTLDFEVPSPRVFTLLEASVVSIKEILEQPKPQVLIDSVTDRGVKYIIRFWVDISKVNITKAKHLVYASAIQHIHQSGLSLSYAKHDLYYRRMPKRQLDRHRDIKPLLMRVPLFKMLNKSELEIIHKGIKEVSVKEGESIVEAGTAGSSMFIVVEGVLHVYVDKVSNSIVRRIKVNQLIPGDFFGEMSLLTGEPRSATITSRTDSILYEIKKKTIMSVLKERPEVSMQLSKVLAERVISNESVKVKYQDDKGKLASTIFSRMKEFFFGI